MRDWIAAADPADPAGALAAIVHRVAEALDVVVELRVGGRAVAPTAEVSAVDVDPAVYRTAGPWLPGFAREALLSAGDRRRDGVHHTSPAMAATLVEFVTDLRPFGPDDLVVDPAVGGGAFLLAACEAMPGDRGDRLDRVRGFDVDPLAVATTEAALALWAGRDATPPDGAIRVLDALDGPWPITDAAVVIGNPPFRSQLRDGTVRDGSRRVALAARWPELGGYVDDAAAFLLAGVDHVGDGGVVALVQPASFLSARDAAPVRARLLVAAPPVGLWTDGGRRFAASVDTVAVLVEKGATAGRVVRRRGVPARPRGDHPPLDRASWGSLLLENPPAVPAGLHAAAGRTVGDVAHVTAGFRDQFYGLRDAVFEASDGRGGGSPRLVTSGLIDPLECRWGEAPCRFDKRRWLRPAVDPAKVDPAIRGWVEERLVPKLVVASQTRVVEVAVDRAGDLVPCTPVVSVEPRPGAPSLGHLAVALLSPLASLLLLRDAAGSALSADAMRVSASAVASLPLPPEGPAWDAAAAAVDAVEGPPSATELAEIGRLSLAAHGLADRSDLLNWWHSRSRGR